MGSLAAWAFSATRSEDEFGAKAFTMGGKPIGHAPLPNRGATGLPGRGGGVAAFRSASGHKWAMHQTKAMFGIGQKGLGRVLGYGFAAYSAYEGYKQGGMKGAAWGLGRAGVETYLMNRALFFLGSTVGIGLNVAAVGAAIGYGMNKVQGYGAEKLRKHATLEMGAPIEDQFGNIATGRQRAMMAMQRSHINGRSAAGNEAALMYRPYFR